jgi:hypothetical protein
MNTRRDPRADNARKHGLAAVFSSAPTARVPSTTASNANAAERLVDCFDEGRGIGQVKAILLGGVLAATAPKGAGLYAYTNALAALIKLERYERRAESRFLSASYDYAKEEDARAFKGGSHPA